MNNKMTDILTNDEYRQINAWSKSDLDNVNKSLALVEWSKKINSGSTQSVELGTHIHCAMLEPKRFNYEYVKAPDFDLKTKKGRDELEAFKRSIGSDKIILEHSIYQTIVNMRESILAHPTARDLLTKPGQSEISIFSTIEKIKVKARPDRIVEPAAFGGAHILVDVKKTADIDKFKYSVRDFRYHVQDAFYSDVYEAVTGFKPRFLFVVVSEKKSLDRHPVRVFELDEQTKEIGRSEYLQDLDRIKESELFGSGFDVETLDLSHLFKKY